MNSFFDNDSDDYYDQNVLDFTKIINADYDKNQSLFQQFKADINDGKHPIFDAVNDTTTFDTIDRLKRTLTKKFKTIILVGTGGSSLGFRAIANWAGFHHNPLLNNLGVNFFATDNLDDLSFFTLLAKSELDTTCFLVISKSGNTLETNVQIQTILDFIKSRNKAYIINTNIMIITEIKPEKNPLIHIAEKYKIPLFKHSLVIGGRYSVLTMTGLMPTMLIGLDYKAILAGAKSVIEPLTYAETFKQSRPCIGAAALIGAEQQKGLLTHIFANYGDKFIDFSLWIRQLWSESLGKNGKGGLFVPSLNPLDQHSQLQMYYDGIDNKTYSFIECFLRNSEKTILNFDKDSDFSYLNLKTIHDVVHASCIGTVESLRSKGRLIRTFTIDDYNLETLGALMMHFIIETIFASYLLDVNPYDQPAVEDYKIRTKKLLQ